MQCKCASADHIKKVTQKIEFVHKKEAPIMVTYATALCYENNVTVMQSDARSILLQFLEKKQFAKFAINNHGTKMLPGKS